MSGLSKNGYLRDLAVKYNCPISDTRMITAIEDIRTKKEWKPRGNKMQCLIQTVGRVLRGHIENGLAIINKFKIDCWMIEEWERKLEAFIKNQ